MNATTEEPDRFDADTVPGVGATVLIGLWQPRRTPSWTLDREGIVSKVRAGLWIKVSGGVSEITVSVRSKVAANSAKSIFPDTQRNRQLMEVSQAARAAREAEQDRRRAEAEEHQQRLATLAARWLSARTEAEIREGLSAGTLAEIAEFLRLDSDGTAQTQQENSQ